jgi:hypothetical protein
MTGVLFHGPEVFDSGWAGKLIKAAGKGRRLRLILAGTMSRTALHDSGLESVETPGLQPSSCLKLLEKNCSAILIATCSKSVNSGLTFGGLVAGRAGTALPVIQAECAGPVYSVHSGACPAGLAALLGKLGFVRAQAPETRIELWNENGALCRRLTTCSRGDFILVNGIVAGRAKGSEAVIVTRGRTITEVRGATVKPHGLEKLERLGGVDLVCAKLASTPALRRNGARARILKSAGKGVVFIDHAGMHVYALAEKAAGAVTVGDDTTAVAGDILRRYGVPVVGIVDGDGDGLHQGGSLAPGSVVFTVKADDKEGLRVRRLIFCGSGRTGKSFSRVRSEIEQLLASRLIKSSPSDGKL